MISSPGLLVPLLRALVPEADGAELDDAAGADEPTVAMINPSSLCSSARLFEPARAASSAELSATRAAGSGSQSKYHIEFHSETHLPYIRCCEHLCKGSDT